MKLSKSNPFLRSPQQARAALWISAKTSSAIEGIRQPFAKGQDIRHPQTDQAFIDYWKNAPSKSYGSVGV